MGVQQRGVAEMVVRDVPNSVLRPAPVAAVAATEIGRSDVEPVRRSDRVAYRVAKRVTDIVLASVMILALALLWPAIMLAVFVESGGPVLFRQRRVGRGGQPITVCKFRSMYPDAEARLHADAELYDRYCANGYKLPEDADPRVTRVGRFLRKSSLDELPQPFAVLAGSMSLVGPRPVLPVELDELYGADADSYLAVKPGLTGLWQVSGRSHVTGDDRVSLDVEYVERSSWRLDMAILFRTVPAVLCGRGAH